MRIRSVLDSGGIGSNDDGMMATAGFVDGERCMRDRWGKFRSFPLTEGSWTGDTRVTQRRA